MVCGLLIAVASLVADGAQALEHTGFSSCGAWAQLPHSMWDLPRSGVEPMSSALAGGFFTTELPENPYLF